MCKLLAEGSVISIPNPLNLNQTILLSGLYKNNNDDAKIVGKKIGFLISQ